jgi:hypothetical protein
MVPLSFRATSRFGNSFLFDASTDYVLPFTLTESCSLSKQFSSLSLFSMPPHAVSHGISISASFSASFSQSISFSGTGHFRTIDSDSSIPLYLTSSTSPSDSDPGRIDNRTGFSVLGIVGVTIGVLVLVTALGLSLRLMSILRSGEESSGSEAVTSEMGVSEQSISFSSLGETAFDDVFAYANPLTCGPTTFEGMADVFNVLDEGCVFG